MAKSCLAQHVSSACVEMPRLVFQNSVHTVKTCIGVRTVHLHLGEFVMQYLWGFEGNGSVLERRSAVSYT